MRVTPVETGLQPAVAGSNFIGADVFLSQPKFALRWATSEDHMGKAFDLAPDRLVGGLSYARRAVCRTTRDGDQNVLLPPSALRKHLPQLLKVHLELVGP